MKYDHHHSSDCSPTVAILMCTYNGERYLLDQLESFDRQTHINWHLIVSDDGSTDDTNRILDSYSQRVIFKKIKVIGGPSKGFAANFLSLTCNNKIVADFYAYSDQDDIWNVDKIERAVKWLETVPDNVPALYCSRTRLIDAGCNEIGLSPLFGIQPSFSNAIIQSIAGGNTMVFNNAARMLLCEAGEDVPVITHDWWIYMVVTGCGGKVYYDCYPSLLYRQHDGNLVGMNASWLARFKRMRMLWEGSLRHWNDCNIIALQKLRHKLTADNREILECFAKARQKKLIPRLIGLKRSGIHRQTVVDNLGLVVAAIFGKI